MPEVDSSAIRQVEYETATSEMTVVFTTGRTYRYFAVPESVYDGLLAAPSCGAYFNRHVSGVYGFQEVSDPRDPPTGHLGG